MVKKLALLLLCFWSIPAAAWTRGDEPAYLDPWPKVERAECKWKVEGSTLIGKKMRCLAGVNLIPNTRFYINSLSSKCATDSLNVNITEVVVTVTDSFNQRSPYYMNAGSTSSEDSVTISGNLSLTSLGRIIIDVKAASLSPISQDLGCRTFIHGEYK